MIAAIPKRPSSEDYQEGVTRVCAAVLVDDRILMVKHRQDGHEYWTLPGGHVGTAERHDEAVVRELQEETGLRGAVVRLLFSHRVSTGQSACYLVEVADPHAAALGNDPELPPNEQWLVDVRWFPIAEKAEDFQVAEVLRALG